MKLRTWTLCLTLGALLLAPSPAFADGKGDAGGLLLVGPLLLALVLFPVGLAVHGLLLTRLPRRGLGLVEKERQRVKTIVLGLLDTGFFWFVALAAAKPAPALAALSLLLWSGLALVGSYGLARALGARLLGSEQPSGAPRDLLELALGWFVIVFATALPLVGPLLGLYWAIRGAGLTVLALLQDGATEVLEVLPDPHDRT